MPKYIVTGAVTISVHTEVEAENEQAAIYEAGERPMMSFCWQCSHGEPDQEWVTSGELDGEVCDEVAELLDDDAEEGEM